MGTTKLSQEELASRIQVGRYEIAYKPEVKAFVDQRLKAMLPAITGEIQETAAAGSTAHKQLQEQVAADVRQLELRIIELEMTTWQRFKRWAGDFIEDMVYAVSHDPSQFPMDDALATILPHGAQADLDREDAEAFAIELQQQHRLQNKASVIDPYAHLARSLREMPTECAEDLAENPVIQEAIDAIKKFEGEDFDPNRYRGLLPELQGLPEYTAEEMPSVPEQRRTHDGELTPSPDDLDRLAGYYKRAGLSVTKACDECGVAFGVKHKDGCVSGAIAAIEAFEKSGTPLPDNVHRLSIPPAESLGDPEE